MADRTADPLVPDAVVFNRAPVLKRALRGLPGSMLTAMVDGIEREQDRLVAGRLYSEGGGGCAVGAMLRVLFPGRRPGRLSFWLQDRRIFGIDAYPEMARAYPRLRHLELAFDTSVKQTHAERPGLTGAEAARAVGLWFSAEAQAELVRRRAPAAGAMTAPGRRVRSMSVN